MRWLVLKEGLRGIEFHDRPGTPAWGDGESCLRGARCSRSASGGQQFPTDGHTNLGVVESYLGCGRCSRRACR